MERCPRKKAVNKGKKAGHFNGWGEISVSPMAILFFKMQKIAKMFSERPDTFDQAEMKFVGERGINVGEVIDNIKELFNVALETDFASPPWFKKAIDVAISNNPILRRSLERNGGEKKDILRKALFSLECIEKYMVGTRPLVPSTWLIKEIAVALFDGAVLKGKRCHVV